MSGILFQLAAARRPAWIEPCLESARAWAAGEGLSYRLYGDEAFAALPGDLVAKCGGRLQMVADLARLAIARRLLEEEGWDRAVYADADFLVWDQAAFDLEQMPCDRGAAFGQEYWVTRDGPRLKLHRNVHNAFMIFEKGGSVLPFYEETARHLLARVEGGVPPQFLGPKLLSALQGPAAFSLLPQAGALSPDVIADLLGESDGRALHHMEGALPQPLGGANLCASLLGGEQAGRLVEKLLTRSA